jgi:hypothetical protein
VASGGTAAATEIDSGAVMYVASGGTTDGASLDGGNLDLASGAAATNAPLTFGSSAGGVLTFGDSVDFGGTVAGFGEPDELDLLDISYNPGITSAEADDDLSGTLTVSDGTHVANIALLGQYVTANFNAMSDGQGGTLVTDPPAAAATDANPTALINPHHP